MIYNLTPAQRDLMYSIRDEWINNLTTIKLDEDKVRKGLEFLYSEAGLKPPSSIVFVDSPLDMQYAYHSLSNLNLQHSVFNSVSNSIRDSVWDCIKNSVWDSVRNTVRNSVWNTVSNSVGDSICNSIWDSVWDSVYNSVRDSVRDSVKNSDQKIQYQSMSNRGSIGDWYWVSFYDFFDRIGLNLTPKFSIFRDFCCLSGAYDYLLYNDCAIVCSLPSNIKWDYIKGIRVASSNTGPSIKWSDGFKIYQIRGTRVPEHVVIAPHTITINEIQNEQNLEVRRIMIEQYGTKDYLKDIKSSIIDFDIHGINNGARILLQDSNDDKWLLVTDGSTDRLYTMAVNSDSDSCSEAHSSLCGFNENLIKLEG